MLTARSTLLVVLGARAVAGEEAFRTDMLPASQSAFTDDTTFGISDITTAVLTTDVGIVCYSDWTNPEDGKCKVVNMAQDPPTYGDAAVLTLATEEDLSAGKSGKAQRFAMSRFSDTLAVVCYTPFGDQVGVPVCRTLTVSDENALSAGSEFEFVPNSTTDVYTMSLESLTEDRGVLCFQDTSAVTAQNVRNVVCTILQVSGESLSVPERIFNETTLEFLAGSGWTYVNVVSLNNIQAISLAVLSETAAVVCYNDGTGLAPDKEPTTFCNKLAVTSESLSIGGAYDLGAGRDWPPNTGSKAVSVAAFSDTDGVACVCNDDEGPVCTPLDLLHDDIGRAGEPLQIGDNGDHCREVTVVAMSDTAAVVCWLTSEQEVKTQRGMCKGLSYLSKALAVGDADDAEEFPQADGATTADFTPPKGSNDNRELWQDNDCESWFSVSKRDESNAMACYSAVGGSMVGRCVELTIPDPTTTVTTATSTETSTTSQHTTTESSTTTVTETSTTITFTTETTSTQTSSTTPHTTTATETTTTTTTPSLSGGRSAFLALPALLVAAVAAAQ
jgi:hypothetical protein